MPAEIYFNVAISGLFTGLVYGLMALGLSVIFGVVRVVNFAHGEMMTLAMYLTLALFGALKLDPLVLVNVQLIVFGPDARGIRTAYSYDSFQLGPLIVDASKVYAAGAALVVAAALFAFFRWTLLGKSIRACADNYQGALVVGLDVKRLYALTFGIGSACVGAAGAMLMAVTDVTPTIGPAYTLLAFVIVITGGLGSMPGALLGGLLIGLTEALGGVLFTPSAKSMFAFGLLVLVLLFRPQGILGRKAA